MESSYKSIKDYFDNLVDQSNFLNDFVGFFQREWANRTAAVTNKLASPNLTLFKYKLGFDGPEENTIAVRQIGFAIMFNKIDTANYEAQYNIKDSVEISPVELSASDFGVEVFFNLRNKQLLKVDPTDWKDIDQVCT